MPQTKKISAGQLMILLLLARVMHAMIYRSEDYSSGTAMMLALLCATAVEAVVALPAVWYFNAGGLDPAAEVAGKYAGWVKLLYSVYFTVIAGGTVALFAEFMGEKFSESLPPEAVVILLVIAAAYCAYCGIEGLGRAGAVIFWLFLIMFILMAAVSEGEFDWLNVRPMEAGDGKQFWSYFTESLTSSWWLPMLCALGVHLKNGVIKAAYGYLVLKLLILETLVLLITLVLWRYVNVLGYPILALGAYAKTDFIQRFDAINMLVWALNCTIVVGVYLFISSGALKKPRPAVLLFAAAAAVFGVIGYKIGLTFDQPWFLWFKAVGIILLGIILPAAAGIKLIIKRSAAK